MFSCTLRRGTLALLGVILVSLLGGCFQMKMGAEFRADGTIAVSQEWTATNEIAMDKIHEQRAEAQKEGAQIQDRSNGFVATQTYENVEQLVGGGAKAWQPTQGHHGVWHRAGFLYDTYDLDLFFAGDAKSNPVNQETDEFSRSMMKSVLDSVKMDFAIIVPEAFERTNGIVSGTTATWDLKPSLSGQDVVIQAVFRVPHPQHVQIATAAAVGIVILGIVVAVIGFVRKNAHSVVLSAVGIALLLVGVGVGGWTWYRMGNTPVLTAADSVMGAAPAAQTQAPADNAKSTQPQPAEKSAAPQAQTKDFSTYEKTLQEKGITTNVIGASGRDEDGFLVMAKEQGRYTMYVYAAAEGAAVQVHFPMAADVAKKGSYWNPVNFPSRSGDPYLFTITIPHDNRSSNDADLGTWNGDAHTFTIYAQYKYEGGKVVPGMLTSASGENPSHYQAYLKEQRNVNIANAVLTHLESLNRDLRERNVDVPAKGQ